MSNSSSKIKIARLMNGLSDESAASICGVTRQTISQRNVSPGSWRLGELKAIYDSLNSESKTILLDGVHEFFLK